MKMFNWDKSESVIKLSNYDHFDLPPIPTYEQTRKQAYEYPEAEEAFQKLAASVPETEVPRHVQERWQERDAAIETAKLEKQIRDHLEVDKVGHEHQLNYYNQLVHQYFRRDPFSR